MLVYSEEENDVCEREAEKERESKGEVCYLQPAAGIGKGREEEEEPLICPVTGLGQLICWC